MFVNGTRKNGFAMKLWRGERMCLAGFDVDQPEDDFVGFAIECKSPGNSDFAPLRNRLAFSYPSSIGKPVTGARQFSSLEAPFQKFRWIHFPKEPRDGTYTYRATKMHMPSDGKLVQGTSISLDIPLESVTYAGKLDVGFTRGMASSQAYAERFRNDASIIPTEEESGLAFTKKTPGEAYDWLGFEAYQLLFDFLDKAKADGCSLDVFAYDLNEPDIVSRLEGFGPNLRAIIDDSDRHAPLTSDESKAAARLRKSAGKNNVVRMHFSNLQHNKVFIARKNGKPVRVLCGSTNFTFRGLYIQSNNALVFNSPDAAALFDWVFDLAFNDPSGFRKNPIATKWHLIQADGIGPIRFCFSPHGDTDLSLSPVGAAIDQATSSVFYAIAFLNQMTSGPTKEALDRLMDRPVFSYGMSDQRGKLAVKKPDGSIGLVDFRFLAANTPPPFNAEWSGGQGRHIHHKFVVTDFNLPTAKVFTGSSNLSPSGEKGNGDQLVMIEDQKVAQAYAIEAVRTFDHYHFRTAMNAAEKAGKGKNPKPMTLAKPKKISGKPNWFEPSYVADSQKARDRELFSR